ncbi:RNA polymerase II elongation factor [Mortierella sp. GBA35]|nr:RNA polymerase II elongation factor [Mortierella sp. AD031]KAF9101134.1 RNA polymerase II elongation factor [Mortierella sp. GBA35]KAG0207576.1 RNA polymerase II elongation factor [Mortierella sp. NVP41]
MGAANIEQDMLDLKKSLQDAQSKGSTTTVLDLLRQLSKFTVTAALLRKTEMGLFVNKMKTHADNEVSRMAKDIVRNWKSQVTKEASTTSSTTTTATTVKADVTKAGSTVKASSTTTTTTYTSSKRPTVETKASPAQIQSVSRDGSSTASSPRTPTDAGKDRTVRSDGMRIRSTGNDVRDRCIEMLYQALGTNSNAESERLLQKATNIETIVFKNLSPDGAPSQNYKAKIRSFFMNLRDKNNPMLREAVVDGDVKVEDFCDYTTQDMASAEAKARDREIQLENMFKAKGAEAQQAETDMFKCGKCKGRKCRYYQMQTRSADEPMTTFVTCINCDNRWKFS